MAAVLKVLSYWQSYPAW